MSDNNVVEILHSVVGELKNMARTESIVGAPITVGDKTVIPIIKMTVGFGAGGGQGEYEQKGSGFGGGGGGGVSIEPAAFIIMDKDGISLLPAKKGNWESLVEAIPGVASKIAQIKDKFKGDKGSDQPGKAD